MACAMSQTLSIASWNINSVRFRIDIVERFLRDVQPDILCLQETKVVDRDFPSAMFRQLGYTHQVLHGQPMHHGVAILSRVPMREDKRFDWQDNGEARHVGVELECGFRLDNVYIPAGGEEPDPEVNPKFAQKLAFLDRMTQWSSQLTEPTLLVGDFNVAPLESDVWGHKQLLNVVSHTPVEVAAMDRFQQSHGWVDLGRQFIPEPEQMFTWWSYRARDWKASNRGRRLDHMWASPAVAARAVDHKLFEDCRNWGKPSDHIPILTTFRID
jgi:exodeoxyribonuclease-3